MQIIQSQTNIVEKVIRDKQGRLVRAKFFIYESAGRVKARLIEFKYLEEALALAVGTFLLSFYKQVKSNLEEFFAKRDLAFVPIKTDDLDYSGSKPRAPTFR